MHIEAQLIDTWRGRDGDGDIERRYTVDVNGIQFVEHDRAAGGVTTERGKPGIVYHRGDTLYRGVYRFTADGEDVLESETAYDEVAWPHFAAAIRFAIAEKGLRVTITTDHSASRYQLPVVLIDGELTDLHQYL